MKSTSFGNFGFKWGDYTYWTFDFYDNRVALAIVAYDSSGSIVRQWEEPNGRYINNLEISYEAQTVTFGMLQGSNIKLNWSDLEVQ